MTNRKKNSLAPYILPYGIFSTTRNQSINQHWDRIYRGNYMNACAVYCLGLVCIYYIFVNQHFLNF